MTENQYTIGKTIDMFLENISLSRSENTERTYRNAMNAFKEMLSDKKISNIKENQINKNEFYKNQQ